jgi:hypothetical protein
MSVYLLGPVGAAAGRFVIEVGENTLNLWGVGELQVGLAALRPYGVDLKGFASMQFNTTGALKTETLTLVGMGEGGSDLTQTYNIEPWSFMIAAAGKLLFHVPTFDAEDPFGEQLFRVSGVGSLAINAEGMTLFTRGDLEVGPPDVRLFDVEALGVLVINDRGIAGDVFASVKVGDIDAIKDHFKFNVSAPQCSM